MTTYDERIEDLFESLEITKITPRKHVGGTWINGRIGGHAFNALVFADHAEVPEYELDRTRISKFWLRRTSDKVVVANFDRGWDVRPTTPIAETITELLTEGLAGFAVECAPAGGCAN
jgi:hypothetical protein